MKEIFKQVIKNWEFNGKPKNKITGSMKEVIIPDDGFQSFTIQLGNCIEKSFNEYVKSKGASIVSDSITIDGEVRQADLYFSYKGNTYYFESKNNINLDTEKTKDVNTKVINAPTDFKGVVTFRFVNKEDIPLNLLRKFVYCKIYTINDFLKIFGEEITEEDWNEIVEVIKEKYKEFSNQKS